MVRLSTPVLDAMNSRRDGRLLDAATLAAGRDRLLFGAAALVRALGVEPPGLRFLKTTPLEFGVEFEAGARP